MAFIHDTMEEDLDGRDLRRCSNDARNGVTYSSGSLYRKNIMRNACCTLYWHTVVPCSSLLLDLEHPDNSLVVHYRLIAAPE